jgi:hypothetical protein
MRFNLYSTSGLLITSRSCSSSKDRLYCYFSEYGLQLHGLICEKILKVNAADYAHCRDTRLLEPMDTVGAWALTEHVNKTEDDCSDQER